MKAVVRMTLVLAYSLISSPMPATGAEPLQRNNALKPDGLASVQSFLEKSLTAWKGTLKLKEWDIKVYIVRRAELKPKTLGNISWEKNMMQASIRVMHPDDYARLPFDHILDDMEMTLVHELVHLKISNLPRSEESRTIEERVVNDFASALLDLHRHLR